MARKCANWLLTFRDWTLPRSEAPETYIFWTGLFALSSVIKRHVVIAKEKLGSWEVYPNLYIVFVAPPGRARKTTTLNYADDLLGAVPNINVAAQSMTQQVLMKRIADTGDCSISLRIGELGTFINPSGDVMIDFLTSLYDGRKSFGNDTLARNLELATNPCVNLIAATTPLWIANNLSETMVGGGFTSRVVHVFEDNVRRRQLFYEELDYKYLDLLRSGLIEDLTHIATNINGEFAINEEAKPFIESWYRENAEKNVHDDYRMQGYYERKPGHVFKLAILLHLAYSDEREITLEDFNKAIVIIEQVEKKMPLVFQSVGKNPYTTEMDSILEFVQIKRRVSRKDLLSRFYHAAPPETLASLINGLIVMERIKITQDGFYTAVNGVSLPIPASEEESPTLDQFAEPD